MSGSEFLEKQTKIRLQVVVWEQCQKAVWELGGRQEREEPQSLVIDRLLQRGPGWLETFREGAGDLSGGRSHAA